MSDINGKLELVRKAVGTYENFPKPGIIFRDVFSILKDPKAFRALHDVCLNHVRSLKPPVEAIAGLDSRGFLFGPMLALELEIPFIPIRKKGKLPGKVRSLTYDLEYGQDTLEVQVQSLKAGTKILIIDDLLATGGSMSAACKLLEDLGLDIIQCFVILELKDLMGRSKVANSVHSLIQY